MRETCSLLIAAQDIDVWRVTERNDRGVPSAAQLTRYKELTSVPSRRLVSRIQIGGWHGIYLSKSLLISANGVSGMSDIEGKAAADIY